MSSPPTYGAPELIVREHIQDRLAPQTLQWIERCLGRIYPILGCPPDSEACVVITDDKEIQELNLTWRALDEPTDVLSFAYQEADDAVLIPQLLGDVILSIDTAARYAQDAQHAERIGQNNEAISPWTLQHELTFLIAHGFLHLLGFDHIEAEDEAIMRPLEQEVFQDLIASTPPTPRTTRLQPPAAR